MPRTRNPHIRRTAHGIMLMALWLAAAGIAHGAERQHAAVADEEPPPPRYAVEIILFEYSDTVADGGEVFAPQAPADDGRAGIEDDAERSADGLRAAPVFTDRGIAETPAADSALEEIESPAKIALRVLAPEQLTLQAEYDTLVRLDAYRPVLWTGWVQATYEQDITPAVMLRRIGSAPLDFDGTFKLYLSRFLHLVVDLRLAAPQPSAAARFADTPRYGRLAGAGGPAATTYYRIDEDRIMKNGDLRYFDHPKFGLLARVTRVEEAAVPGGEDVDGSGASAVDGS